MYEVKSTVSSHYKGVISTFIYGNPCTFTYDIEEGAENNVISVNLVSKVEGENQYMGFDLINVNKKFNLLGEEVSAPEDIVSNAIKNAMKNIINIISADYKNSERLIERLNVLPTKEPIVEETV